MAQVLCPVLVGREREVAELDEALQAARIGRGRFVLVSGEAGIGKSRLAQALIERARLGGVTVASGRAVEGSSVAFRPLAEALNELVRDLGPPVDRDLEPYHAVLSTLVPSWAGRGQVVIQPGLVLLEGVLRLLRSIARRHALLVVLEDLQWADSDSLVALEYLADHVSSERVLLVGTERSGMPGMAADHLARLVSRRVAVRLKLGALADDAAQEMARVSLGVDFVPPVVLGAIRRRAEGVPFLIEEMLSAYLTAAATPDVVNEWRITGRIAESLPPSFRDLVHARLATLDGDSQQVVTAAATLGRTFEWPLLMTVTGLDRARVIACLRAAVAAHLLVGAASDVDAFSFRHALMREAVLGELLPPERAELAYRVAEAIEDQRPGLPGEWCERAAELRELAGDDLGACRLLQESARRALHRGALESAEASLRRAREQARGDYVLWMGVYTLLCEVLARAGKTEELVEMTRALVAEWERTMRHAPQSLARMVAGPRRAQIYLDAARAGLVGGDYALAGESLSKARGAAPEDEKVALRARSLEAAVQLAVGDPDTAAREASASLEAAERLGLHDVLHEALEISAMAAAEQGDHEMAASLFGRLCDSASRDGSTLWRLRALAALGAIESRRTGDTRSLDAARTLAVQTGAVSLLAAIDLELGWQRLALARFDEARTFFAAALDSCRLFALPQRPEALLGRAALYALQGKAEETRSSLRETLAEAGERSDVRAAALGEVEAVLALVNEDRARARALLKDATGRAARWRMGKPWFFGLCQLLDVVEGSGTATGLQGEPAIAAYGWYAEAVRLGRTRKPDDAAAALARADALMPPGWRRHHAHRIVAEAALADGWGDPAALAGAAIEFFETAGLRRIADASKRLQRLAGVPARRAGRGASTVPASLRPFGITSREMDVLALVGEGLSNASVAQQLFLSPRTVETHVKSLMRKAGTNTRAQLVAFAARHRSSGEPAND
ncbi:MULTISPECIES: ATP-binding protein [Nocardioides]|uniref:ATP-binding protein n=1 Tax=Nocardioides vastitatis TaxID=2568655 RepID=A0ABW0ZLA8_9ACTN|nr:LuxR family transcriptional regulator [Nocardioides sp.]THJ10719.1 hypothetical protein E7Z54_02565 [Nocardioides sp.]